MTLSRAERSTITPSAPVNADPTLPDAAPRRRLTRKRVIAAVVVVVLAGGGTAAYVSTAGRTNTTTTASPVSITNENVKVATATMTQTVSASGTLTPADDDTLTFGVSGTVTAVDVTTGQKVTKGQTLATIDSTALADQVSADQATLTSDEDRLTTDDDDSASTSTIDSDEAQITSAKAALSTAEADLADATLKATFSGTVAAVDLAVGDVIGSSGGNGAATAGGSSTGAATSSSSSSSGITVISADTYTMTTSVDDTEVSEVKAGDQVDITPGGSSTKVYGTVASVSLIASSTSSSSSSSSVASFPVVVDVTGSPTGIYPGDSATASIVVKQIQNAVEVPTAAISYANGQATVTEVVNGSHTTVDVTTGVTLNGETQITGGLKAGDTIVEQVAKFNAGSANARTLFGGSTSGRTGGGTGTGNVPSGGFPGGGNFSGGGPGGPTGGGS